MLWLAIFIYLLWVHVDLMDRGAMSTWGVFHATLGKNLFLLLLPLIDVACCKGLGFIEVRWRRSISSYTFGA